MAVYKITYQLSGDSTQREVSINSDKALAAHDPEVVQAAVRDSANYTTASSSTSVHGLRVITVTEVK